MIGTETIVDPNVAAFYVHHCAFRLIVVDRPHRHLTWWGRLFTWEPWDDVPIKGARRVGTTLYVPRAFAQRMEFYLLNYRLEARERRAGYEVDCPHAA